MFQLRCIVVLSKYFSICANKEIIINTYYLGLACCNKFSIFESLLISEYSWTNTFSLMSQRVQQPLCLCRMHVNTCVQVSQFIIIVYVCCCCILYICFFVYIIFIFLDKGLILLFCIFPCNYCFFLSSLFLLSACGVYICLVIIVNKPEVWWQFFPVPLNNQAIYLYLPPTLSINTL